MSSVLIRSASKDDIDDLLEIEEISFKADCLSRRSFQNFIKPGSHDLLVMAEHDRVIGYALTLYRSGTNLARLYSVALLPQSQGKGYALRLLSVVEKNAADHHCVYIRLEVDVNNVAAIGLYETNKYRVIGRIDGYYEDGSDALRMEKRLHSKSFKVSKPTVYYQQTTEFTCGPSSLMMAIKALRPTYLMTRHEELQIWREATTIFMTSGHGGCSPHGLALSAWRRQMHVCLYVNSNSAPFVDGVRDEEKKSVLELVHHDFLEQMEQTNIRLYTHELGVEELDSILRNDFPVLALISTWRLNRNKAPHWVYVAGSDDKYVYINDPDIEDEKHFSQIDFEKIPIEKKVFRKMARFGQKKLRALLVISDQEFNESLLQHRNRLSGG